MSNQSKNIQDRWAGDGLFFIIEEPSGELTKAGPRTLPEGFWEEESRRLVAVLLPHITALAMEGIQNGAAKVGITINYAIYSLLAEQWAREYTDQLLKNVRTTNEAVVGDILANWIAMPGRTIGDLRAALEPWFGTKRADVIAITEATRALASGELMAFQRAGVEEIRWGTNHDELVCPLCGPLHGQVRKIGEPFGYFKWRKGAAPEPVFVPPYHPNCRCGISPVVKLRRLSFASVPNSLIIANTLAMVRPAGVYELVKGDFEGHPFRGNQWVDGDLLHGEDKNKDVDTTMMPLSLSVNWNDLRDEEYRDFLRQRASKGIYKEVVPQLERMNEFATDPGYKNKSKKILYFGLGGDKFKNMNVGDVFYSTGTRSTTLDFERAKMYGKEGAVFELELPEGAVAVNAKDILGLPEIMLLPSSKFRVTSIESDRVKLEMIEDGSDYIKELYDFQNELREISNK